jgi:DNA gyrase/topoisomerase IV subunit A
LTVTGRTSQGTMIGIGALRTAFTASSGDEVVMVDKDNKAKRTAVDDLSENSRTSKGQEVMPDIKFMALANGRDTIYGFTTTDKIIEIALNKLSVKGKTAGGVTTTARALKKII